MASTSLQQQRCDGKGSELTAATSATTTTSDVSSSTTSCAAADENHAAPKRVLTVGDGNFSYSLAYAKRFVAYTATGDVGVELTATSYDSYDELVDKYPESARICAQIRELGAHVLHRVDATNLKVSLQNAVAASDQGMPSASDNKETAILKPEFQPFDVIIFNHPHCGEENVKRHKSLLSHFYTSALEILSQDTNNKDSEIHLTLAKGQPERWEAVKRARMAGLMLKQQIDDVDSHDRYGLEYERKRHQNGKSFHRVLLHGEKLQQQSTLFIFTRQGAGHNDMPTESPSAAMTTEAPSRKRKAQDMTTQQQQPLEFACSDCEKSFKTAQGLKTHEHMVHELGQGSSTAAGTKSAALLPCGFCERMFKNEDAQRQHRLAKHGEDQLIQPDWYQKQQELQASGGEATKVEASTSERTGHQPQQQQLTCSICHLVYPTQSAFDAHWQDLKPKEVVLRTCTHCGRGFDEERALRQHQNFCKVQAPEDRQ